MRIRVGHSPDPDDAFMYWGLASGRAGDGLSSYRFEEVVEEIESLNARALAGGLEFTALSLHAYGRVADRYRLLRTGGAFGEGYGPVVVSKNGGLARDLAGVGVAVPGLLTTAALLLRIFAPAARPRSMPFDRVLPAVGRGEVEAGLLIHEGQITYEREGFRLALDLGAAWRERTGLPLPLGFNAVRRDLPAPVRADLARLHRAAIEAALENRDEALAHAMRFARGLSRSDADRFVGMYVNRRTLEMGEEGRKAMRILLDEAARAGAIPPGVPLDFQPEDPGEEKPAGGP